MRAPLAVLALSSLMYACSSSSSPSRGADAGARGPADSGAGTDAATGPKLEDVLAGYGKAWEVTDATSRLSTLEGCFATDGIYTDSIEKASGRAAFSDLIGTFQGQFPGATITFTTGVDAFEDQFRYGWQITLADGKPFMTGEDQGQIGKDGLITRMTGFFEGTAGVAAPKSLESLVAALNGATPASRLTELASAVIDGVSWTDRWMHTDGRASVADHFDTWLTPGPGTTFALTGTVSLHDDLLRADLTLTQGNSTDEGQVFAHLTPSGLMDWVTFHDGPLPPK